MSSKVQGKEFMFTGKLSMTRATAQSMVMKAGGIAGSSVNKGTDYLVVGTDYGSKFAKALSYGIPITNEQEFWSLFVEDEDYEEPLTRDELAVLKGKEVQRTCLICNWYYKEWESVPDDGKCPTCGLKELITNNITGVPYCPNCQSSVIYVEDFKEYYCDLCGTWFKAPYATAARKLRHICKKKTLQETTGGYLRICVGCGKDGFLSHEEYQEMVDKYNKAPIWVKQWIAYSSGIRADLAAKHKARMDRVLAMTPGETAELQQLYESEQFRRLKRLEKRRNMSHT